MVIPHILYQASNAKEVLQFISMETGCPVTMLLTSCLPLCMTLVLTSYAIQHDRTVKDERSVALHNMLIDHLSAEVDLFNSYDLNLYLFITGDQLNIYFSVGSVYYSLIIS